MSHPKVERTHQTRRAVVYLRQSTMKQVHEHRESTRRQYALRERAEELGWPAHAIDVVDDDLGQSGTSTQDRVGFQRMAEEVSQGRVGAIFALEVSRFSRSSVDWHRLLELCGLADVLIADEHDVFAPNDPNDRLLLGLKGQMSEAERYWMRLRLRGARESKARRGELKLVAPTGYVWDASSNRLELDPDEEVQREVQLVFERFQIDGSAGGVIAYFVEHGLQLPTRRRDGELIRRRPILSRMVSILHNPIYAGAYVYGRREYRTALVDGEVRRGRMAALSIEAWKVRIPERHAAYISWEQFVANQKKLEGNRNRRRMSDGHGAAREGQALLQGLVLCGQCGYRMRTQQGGQEAPRYVCAAPVETGLSTKVCWSVAASAIDATVAQHFLDAAQPPEIELSLAVTHEVERQASDLDKLWKARLERARYEAQLAERRYKAVDPDNRVVARSLEADWEAKLRSLQELEQAHHSTRREQKLDLSPADRAEILSLARDLPRVWNAASSTNTQRKNMLRLLVEEVALTPIDVPHRMTRIRILWHTGAVTETMVERPRSRAPSTSDKAIERIRALTELGWRDRQIAEELNRQGIESCKKCPWTDQMVRGSRKRRGIRSPHALSCRDDCWPEQRSDGLFSLRGVACRLGVSRGTVRRWIGAGHLEPAEGGGRGRPSWFALDGELERRLLADFQGARSRVRAN